MHFLCTVICAPSILQVKKLCTRLFPENKPSQDSQEATLELVSDSAEATGSVVAADSFQRRENSPLSYADKLDAQFKVDLQNIGLQKKKNSDIFAEISLASKTGDLTDRLLKLKKALESVQASSVEAERAFSIAGRFVTKIRNRLSDKTLDSYCFAKQQFLNERRLVAINVSSGFLHYMQCFQFCGKKVRYHCLSFVVFLLYVYKYLFSFY